MITETLTDLTPERVIEDARQFFTDEGALHSATIVDESETHITLGMFRSRMAISAFPDALEAGRTRVRVSSLRRTDVVGKFLAFIRTGGTEGAASATE